MKIFDELEAQIASLANSGTKEQKNWAEYLGGKTKRMLKYFIVLSLIFGLMLGIILGMTIIQIK